MMQNKPISNKINWRVIWKEIEIKLICLGVPAAGFAIILTNLPQLNPFSNIHIFIFVLMNVVAEYMAVVLPNGVNISLSFPIMIFVLLIWGAPAALWIFIPGSLVTQITRKKEPFKIIYNMSQVSVAVYVTGLVLHQNASTLLLARDLPRIFIAILVFDLLNFAQVIKIVSFQTGKKFFPTFKESWLQEMATVRPIYYAAGIIMAICYQNQGLLGALLVVIPILGAFFQLNTQKELKNQTTRANTDALTGLCNRYALSSWWDDRLPQIIHANQPLSVIMLDIDDFKRVNDRFGHDKGDQVLQMVSDVLRDCIRQSDCIFRYGGEEFVVLLPNSNIQGATLVAQRICQSIAQSELKELDSLCITVSAGLSCLNQRLIEEEKDLAGELIRRADKAMYVAKQNGKNQIQVYQ